MDGWTVIVIAMDHMMVIAMDHTMMEAVTPPPATTYASSRLALPIMSV